MHFAVGYATSGIDLAEIDNTELQPHVLAAQPAALAVVHYGPVQAIAGPWQGLAGEVEARRLVAAGPGREVYHEVPTDRPQEWVIEVQQPVAPDHTEWLPQQQA